MATRERFQFLSNALNGQGGFSNGDYLIQYPRENDEKFTRRKELAFYENKMHSTCLRFAGYLCKKSVLRDINNPLLTAFVSDCDWQQNSLDVFWHSFIINAKARGSLLLVIDMPDQSANNLQEQIDQRLFPYLSTVLPENVISHSVNQRGLIERIEFKDFMTVDGKSIEVIRYYDIFSWKVTSNNKIIKQGRHRLGLCPVLFFTEFGCFPCQGEYAQIADISKRLYNMRSELDEILRGQTFSLIVYPADVNVQATLLDEKVAETISTSNMLRFFGNTPPAFIAPPEGPATIYGDMIEQLNQQIKEIGYTIEQPNHQESGISLGIRFQALNSALTLFARRMEDLERRMWRVVIRWLEIKDTPPISWPGDYSLADVGVQIEIAQNMQMLGAPESYTREKMKQLITLDMPTLSNEELDAMMLDIDNQAAEVNTGVNTANEG